ncbi:uncharacterized protein SCHCODRAFT_02553452, partial [Schizophyllum commune H4-8]|uniref:uncharacterized protein n=1 Tax=Schizophyllum commune (strain H4-8 / FGSC 9210) TaxID=578458 RepID=UPI00215F1BC4
MTLRCLDLPEIVGNICEELQCSDSFGSLAAFAVTDRLVCQVALDALWREQRSLVPLLKILPQHRVDEVSSRELRLVIKEPISPQGWARMQYYASRIILLNLHRRKGGAIQSRGSGSYHTFYDMQIDDSALKSVSDYAGPHCIFPRLLHLDCSMFEPKSLALIPMLFSPSITSLTAGLWDGDSAHSEWLLRDLPNLCPGLRSVTGMDCKGSRLFPPPDLLRRLLTLESLTMAHLSIETIQCLDKLSSLHSLDLRVTQTFMNQVDRAAPPSPSLQIPNAMRHVKLELEDPAGLERFFAVVQTPLRVTAFDAVCYEEEDANLNIDVRHRNLDLLAQALDPTYLKQILYYHNCDIDLSWGPVPGAHVLQLAYRYPNLSYLGIDCWVDACDRDLAALAQALPQLEYLIIDTHAMNCRLGLDAGTRQVRTTLGVLPAITRACPKLCGLCIRLDATSVPELKHATGTDVDIENLRGPKHARMHFADSPLEDPSAVARYLRCVFARGRSLASQPPREGMYKRWKDNFWEWDESPTTAMDWPTGRWPEVRLELIKLDSESD